MDAINSKPDKTENNNDNQVSQQTNPKDPENFVDISLVTWNVHCFRNAKYEDSTEAIVRLLNAVKTDFVLFQEAGLYQAFFLFLFWVFFILILGFWTLY
jgi:hypothetical protein